MRASAGKIDKVIDFENGRVDVEISLESGSLDPGVGRKRDALKQDKIG